MSQKFLTKEQELKLGQKIQSYLKLKEKHENNPGEPLTIEEEIIMEEGKLAVEELVSNNMRLVYKIANNYSAKYPGAGELEDVIQEGMVGMMNAVNRYDPSRQNKFSTVAVMWIKQNIGRSTNEKSRMVRLPENRVIEYMKMREIERTILDAGGTLAEANQEIMNDMGLTLEKIGEIRAATATHASLNKVVGDTESSKEFGEFFPSEKEQDSIEDFVLKNTMFANVYELLEDLSDIEKAVLVSSFSIDIPGVEQEKPKEIKAKYSLSNQQFNKVLDGAIKTLKDSLDTLGISFEDFIF